jgi:uncharacterized membrane protein HdeD (DUF308 family)
MASAETVRSWWVPVLVGVVSIIAGILAIAYPDVSLLVLALITGLNLIMLSALMIGETLGDDEGTDKTLSVVVGVLGILAGIVIVRRPSETLLVLVLAIGIWMVLDGIVHVVRSVFGPSGHRLLRLLTGLFEVGFGVVILALPDVSLGTLAVLVGIAFVIRGTVMVAAGLLMRHVGAEDSQLAGTGPTAAPSITPTG